MSTAAVPLPARKPTTSTEPIAPVWQLQADDEKLMEHCDKEVGREICCKELKGADDRSLIDPDIIRDLVIGFSDGITVPFALTAGLSALGSTHLVVVGGLAELISGAMSMGIGGFLAAQADRNQYLYYMRTTEERVARSCVGEMEREVHEILSAAGVDKKVSELVAASLYRAEMEQAQRVKPQMPLLSLKALTSRVGNVVGLTPFLVHFGEGMEETTRLRMLVSGLTVGMGYLIGGIVPLLPYLIIKDSVLTALWWSIGVTAIVLIIFGGLKSWFTGAGHGVGGVLYGALSTLLIGGIAAGASFGVVKALES